MTIDWNDSHTPTPSLAEYAELKRDKPTLWWRIGCGHHENLFDNARDEIEQLREELDDMIDWEPAFRREREYTDELLQRLARALAGELSEWHKGDDPEWCQRIFGKDADQLPWPVVSDDDGIYWTWKVES